MPTISACLIVKNEARHLDRCLRSLQGVVDEIVVVDTGSTDDSVVIARRHGARVSSFTWCDDFAAARNASIAQARGQWILWVDADEELVETTSGDLRRLCGTAQSYEGFLLTCRNLLNESGESGNEIRQWRLFRNRLGLRFHGRIHEHLLPADGGSEANVAMQDAVWIRHWGYIPDAARTESKMNRNLGLLRKAFDDDPNDPFTSYNIGKQYAGHHRFSEGLPWLRRAIELWHEQGRPLQAYVGNMFALAINAALELGQPEEALNLEQAVPAEVMSPDILFQAGAAWLALGRLEDAEQRFLRAVHDTSIRRHIEGDPSHMTWRPLAALCELELQRGNADKADAYAQQALSYAPEQASLLYAVALTSARLKRLDESVRYARKLAMLPGADERFKQKARRILLNVGRMRDDAQLVVEASAGPIEGLSDHEVQQLRRQTDATVHFDSRAALAALPVPA